MARKPPVAVEEEEEEEEEEDEETLGEEIEKRALQYKSLAEEKYKQSKLKSALKYAKRAHRLGPNLDGVSEMATVFKILHVYSKSSAGGGQPHWCEILQLSRSFLLRIQMSVGTFQSTSKGPRQSCSKSGGYPYDFNHILGVAPRVIKESICFHHSRGENPCEFSSYPVMIIFGIIEIGYSQIQEFHRTWCFSIVAAVMSFTYSHVVLGLDIAKIAGHPEVSTNRSHDDEKGRYVLSP